MLGERELLVADLTRAYPRAAPGRLESTIYDATTGGLEIRGTHAAAGRELLVFYPAAKHGTPSVSVIGLVDVEASDAPGGALYLTAQTTGSDWSLRLE